MRGHRPRLRRPLVAELDELAVEVRLYPPRPSTSAIEAVTLTPPPVSRRRLVRWWLALLSEPPHERRST